MVKKKGKSKRISFKDKYKIEKKIKETNRKRKKQARRDAANGIVHHDKNGKKDPGIPNSWPFKQDLLKEIQRSRERQQEKQQQLKQQRQDNLQAFMEHQKTGGTARTVQEYLQQVNMERAKFEEQNATNMDEDEQQVDVDVKVRSDGKVAAGQQSRRAYLRELKKVVETSDVILQVLDARDPINTRIHPSLENVILSSIEKRMVLVLNKIDLVPKNNVKDWLTALRRSHPTIAIKAKSHQPVARKSNKDGDDDMDDDDDGSVATMNTTKTSKSSSSTASTKNDIMGMEGLLQLLKNYARIKDGGKKAKTTIVVGVIGYPNVGKSSIINALKRQRAVTVSSKPGCTTSMQEVVLDKNVRLLDSPGIVFHDDTTLLGNCIDAHSIEDPIPAVTALLQRCNHERLMLIYNLPMFPKNNVMMFLSMIAKHHYNRVLKGGIPDKMSAARAILKDWNQGKIPYYTTPPKHLTAGPIKHNDAIVVSKFSKEFDLTLKKYDEKVLSSIKDKSDEMDFIQFEQDQDDEGNKMKDSVDNVVMMNDESNKELIEYLSGKQTATSDDDDDDVSMDEDSESEQEEQQQQPRRKVKSKKILSRASLAKAENYDFKNM